MGLTCQRYFTPLHICHICKLFQFYFLSYINFFNNTYLSHLQQFHQYVLVNMVSLIKMRDVQDPLVYCLSSVFPPRECSFVETNSTLVVCIVIWNIAMCAITVHQVHCIRSVSIINDKVRQRIINPRQYKAHSPFLLSSQFIRYSYGCSEIHPQSCFALSNFVCCRRRNTIII